MEIFSAVMLVVFAVIGAISVVREVSYYLFRSKKDNAVMFITPIGGKCEDAELMLRSAAAKVKWVSRGKNDYVICLDCDMDEETRQICESVCRDYGFARMITKQEFFDMIK